MLEAYLILTLASPPSFDSRIPTAHVKACWHCCCSQNPSGIGYKYSLPFDKTYFLSFKMKYGFSPWPLSGSIEKYDHNYRGVTACHHQLRERPGFCPSPSTTSLFTSAEEGVELQHLREAIRCWHSQLQFVSLGYPIISETRCFRTPWEGITVEKCYSITVESWTANSQHLQSIHCVTLSWTFLIIPEGSCGPLPIRWNAIRSISPSGQTPHTDSLTEKILQCLATEVLKSVLEQQPFLLGPPDPTIPLTPLSTARNWVTMNLCHDCWGVKSILSKISLHVWSCNIKKLTENHPIKSILNACRTLLEAIYQVWLQEFQKGLASYCFSPTYPASALTAIVA